MSPTPIPTVPFGFVSPTSTASATIATSNASSSAILNTIPVFDMHEFLFYCILSVVYIMVVHFAFALKDQFNIWLMGAIFVLGGFIGYWFHNFELGFIIAVILSLMFL